jgi:hypothetical protein
MEFASSVWLIQKNARSNNWQARAVKNREAGKLVEIFPGLTHFSI